MATEECGRPEEATCGEVAERQMCTGRLAAAAGANSSGDGGQLVQRAHARGLVVHAYTFRNEVGASMTFRKLILTACIPSCSRKDTMANEVRMSQGHAYLFVCLLKESREGSGMP